MLKNIITDNRDILDGGYCLNVRFLQENEDFNPENELCDTICILSDIENIMRAVSFKLPVVIYAKDKLEDYPVISHTYLVESPGDITEEYLTKVYNRFYGISNIVMSTERLIIREITISDLPALYEVYGDATITQYMEGLYEDYREEEEFTKAYIENMYGFYDYGLWLLEDKKTGKVIGRAGLSNRVIDDENYIELGYVISKPMQRKGYAYEASLAILDYAKNVLKKEKVVICTDKDNLPSIALAHKLGFDSVCNTVCDGHEYLIMVCML